MNAALNMDDDWDREPTALEAAHYNDLLKRNATRQERMKTEAAERSREIFGDCLLRLVRLGMKEGHARSMLGKWRSQAKDDALLVRTVKHASEIATPDPVSYVTKAILAQAERKVEVATMTKGQWTELGWEAPRMTPRGPEWRNGTRGRVWRDPYGKMKVLPPEKGSVVPELADEPGIEVKGIA